MKYREFIKLSPEQQAAYWQAALAAARQRAAKTRKTAKCPNT